jgi:adenosylcobinamide amidohydrolase
MAKQQVKVIEFTGAKLDPDSAYLLAFDVTTVKMVEAYNVMEYLATVGIKNAIAIGTKGDPRKSIHFFEIPKEKK